MDAECRVMRDNYDIRLVLLLKKQIHMTIQMKIRIHTNMDTMCNDYDIRLVLLLLLKIQITMTIQIQIHIQIWMHVMCDDRQS